MRPDTIPAPSLQRRPPLRMIRNHGPTPTQTAGSAVGQELSQTGAQITRINLNVQPTIKVRAAYKFVVRVNRDILFESPHQPFAAQIAVAIAFTGVALLMANREIWFGILIPFTERSVSRA